jgi:8-oxo-dGTP pyrophosphatase MutT (NUDIX family)
MNRHSLLLQLAQYHSRFEEEQLFVPRFLELLQHPNCFLRTHLPGHLTGSAWIVSGNGDKVLLVRHAKLKRWLQPGGHADGDENIANVAMREMQEETGLAPRQTPTTIFDIDIHLIPARADFPAHDHYDIRYLFEVDEAEPLLINEESSDLQWVRLDELEKYVDSSSILRMKDKLLGGNQ